MSKADWVSWILNYHWWNHCINKNSNLVSTANSFSHCSLWQWLWQVFLITLQGLQHHHVSQSQLKCSCHNIWTNAISHIWKRVSMMWCVDGSGLTMHRLEDSSRLIAQDDTAAPLRLHTSTHLETVPSSATFRTPIKKGKMHNPSRRRTSKLAVWATDPVFSHWIECHT